MANNWKALIQRMFFHPWRRKIKWSLVSEMDRWKTPKRKDRKDRILLLKTMMRRLPFLWRTLNLLILKREGSGRRTPKRKLEEMGKTPFLIKLFWTTVALVRKKFPCLWRRLKQSTLKTIKTLKARLETAKRKW